MSIYKYYIYIKMWTYYIYISKFRDLKKKGKWETRKKYAN